MVMESPPSFCTQSESALLSEDSGLLITSGSFSSDSASGWHHVASELQESDFDERSLSLCESTDTSERICGDFFNTVKKGPAKVVVPPIDPPPEFQDNNDGTENTDYRKSELAIAFSSQSIQPAYRKKISCDNIYEGGDFLSEKLRSGRLVHLSPCRGHRPSSRSSLSSRLSSSHNSLVAPSPADDSNFITQAISHETLPSRVHQLQDMYNVPFDSDIYTVPIDMVQPTGTINKTREERYQKNNKKRGKSITQNSGTMQSPVDKVHKQKEYNKHKDSKTKRYSLPDSSSKKNNTESDTEPAHLTLREMRKYLHTIYSNSNHQSEYRKALCRKHNRYIANVNLQAKPTITLNDNSATLILSESADITRAFETTNFNRKVYKTTVGPLPKMKNKDTEDQRDVKSSKSKMSSVRIMSINLKQSFCNLFRWKRGPAECPADAQQEEQSGVRPAAVRRALPPLPAEPLAQPSPPAHDDNFAASIQKVKDYPWYWGNISVEAAEKILSNEPDGSFIVRDSSDDHYIFTLTFKLNGMRHVRIEHNQGNFCFGGCTMFKAQTIVEFIENAVETSRSGRYLFFLNLRPVLGPVRVQLLYPVSRFKRVQSLQHMSRFVILKYVRKDLIDKLPLPRRLLDYLNATHYYSELLAEI